MTHVELLTVEDRFQLEKSGLVVVPDFPVPEGRWKDFKAEVLVVRPDGTSLEAEAHFGMVHFNIRDPEVPISKRWRVVVRFFQIGKDQVPVGSQVMVSPTVRSQVIPCGEA